MNGRRIDYPTIGYLTPDYQVTAVRAANGSVTRIGGSVYSKYEVRGGLKICELLVYKTPLSDRQLEDAQAYLAWKWLGRVLPGYAPPDSATASARPDVDNLVGNGGTIDIPEGQRIRAAKISGEAFVKTGDGVLEVGAGAWPHNLSVRGGSVRQVAAAEPPGASALAAEPIFHVAADEAASLDVLAQDGTNFVERWHDLSLFRNSAWYPVSRTLKCKRPWINTTDTLNGKPTVDFGAVAGSGSTLHLARSIDNARAVYVVYKALSAKDYAVLGTSGDQALDAGGSKDCLYSDFLGGNGSTLLYGWQNVQVKTGDIFMDGQPVAYNVGIGSNYHLVEFHTLAGAHVGAIARDRGTGRLGGVRVAEIVIYDRELSPRERVATRNCLLAKWFPSVPRQQLPAAEAARSTALRLVPETGTIETAGTLSVREMAGESDEPIVKGGAGTLEITSATAFTGTVTVASGVLKLSGAEPPAAGLEPVLEGRLAHFDACEKLFCDASGKVTNWTSKVGALKAMPFVTSGSNTPYVRNDVDLFGQPSVVLPWRVSLRFADANNAWTTLTGVKSVFWVIGTQEGGGYVLAGAAGTYNFHRGYTNADNPVGSIPSRAIVSGAACGGDLGSTAKSIWRLNGTVVNQTSTGFNAAWEVLSMNLASNSYTVPDVGGLAADARAYPETGISCQERAGNQRLGEVIFYDHVLTAEEIARNEAYLNAKWGVRPVRTARENGLTVDLAGGSLDCGNTSQYVAGLVGAGEVANGDLSVGESWTVSLTQTGADQVSATGELAFEPGISVVLENAAELPAELRTKWITVATAASFSGVDNLNAAEIATPGFSGTVQPRFRVRGTALQLNLVRRGTVLVVR